MNRKCNQCDTPLRKLQESCNKCGAANPISSSESKNMALSDKHWRGKKCAFCENEAAVSVFGTDYCPWHAHLNATRDPKRWNIRPPTHLVWQRNWAAIDEWIKQQNTTHSSEA